jgi:hypothetical protein
MDLMTMFDPFLNPDTPPPNQSQESHNPKQEYVQTDLCFRGYIMRIASVLPSRRAAVRTFSIQYLRMKHSQLKTARPNAIGADK